MDNESLEKDTMQERCPELVYLLLALLCLNGILMLSIPRQYGRIARWVHDRFVDGWDGR